MSFTAANSILSKLMSFGAVAVLGWLLDSRDFGLYAMAFSIAAFVQFFRDGGVVQLLVQRGHAEYNKLLGPVFWMALAFNAATAIVLSIIAPIAAHLKGEPQLATLIWVLAAYLPLGTPSIVLTARLQMDLRFGYLNAVSLGSSIIRYGGTITLAATGFGPLSFVLPMPVIAVYEAVMYYIAVGDAPWRRAPNVAMWGELFSHSKWLIFFALSIATLNQGGYMVISMIVDLDKVGVFAFAFQLISQVDALLGTLGVVLFPALARLNEDPARQGQAVMRAVRLLMFLACPAALGLAAVVDPLEQFLWQGKWHDAVWPVQALALFYAARILITIPNAALQARGLFRINAVLTLMAGLGMMAAAGLGAWLGVISDDPDRLTPYRIAECMGIAIGVCCTGFSLWGFARLGLGPGRVLGAVAPSWVIAVASCAAALGLEYACRPAVAGLAERILAAGAPLPLAIIDGVVCFAIAFAGYCAAYGVLHRVFMPARLVEALGIVPARIGRLAAKAALLRDARRASA